MNPYHCLRLAGCWLAAALLLPAAIRPATQSCAIGTPTAQSYTWNFSGEAQGLLGGVVSEARNARIHADNLQTFMSEPSIDWELQAEELSQIRDAVNDMASKLCRLETIRRVASPWERKAIDNAAPLITEMVDETQAAITYLNDNQTHLFNPSYTQYGPELYQRSGRLVNSVGEFVKFGEVHQEDLHLEKSLGLIKMS
jgi:hypothetical protein